jgi:membrane-associated protease RseP (regulator of RpoE activity)
MAGKSTGRRLALLVLAGAAVYLAVWPHELGHAVAAWLLGCKADGWRTGTRWFLWGSEGGEIDFACLARQGRGALALTALAGIAVNLVQIGVASILGVWWRPAAGEKRAWWIAATLLWALANYAEAFSYLVLNTLWLKSDMAGVVVATGISRWPWFAAGILGAGLVAAALLPVARRTAAALAGPGGSPCFFLGFFLIYTAGVGLVGAVNRAVVG